MPYFKRLDAGRIYVLRIHLSPDFTIHKIGMTNSNRSTDRMMEILRSWFTKYRFVPRTELKMDLETAYPREMEKHIHRVLATRQFTPNEDVDGKTEMFCDINETRVIHYLKNFNQHHFKVGLDLTDEDCKNICQLISPWT